MSSLFDFNLLHFVVVVNCGMQRSELFSINYCYIRTNESQLLYIYILEKPVSTTKYNSSLIWPCPGVLKNIKTNQLHAVSRTLQGRQREPNVKTGGHGGIAS